MVVSGAVWTARLLVAAVFGWAGTAKLMNRAQTRQAVSEFGTPDRWVRAVAWALPVVELCVAVGMLAPWTAVGAGVVALGLLMVFSVLVARLLRQGKHPACSCFGASSDQAISGKTLLRNALLGVLVLVALIGSVLRGDVPLDLPFGGAVGLAALTAVGTVQLWQGLVLRRLRGQLAERPGRAPAKGLPVGVVAPAFELVDTGGRHGGMPAALSAGLPVLVLFLRPGCAPCATIAAELSHWRQRLAGKVTILVVSSGEVATVAAWAREHGAGEPLVQETVEVATRYRVPGYPAAVLLDVAGRVARPVAVGSYAIRDLLNSSAD